MNPYISAPKNPLYFSLFPFFLLNFLYKIKDAHESKLFQSVCTHKHHLISILFLLICYKFSTSDVFQRIT